MGNCKKWVTARILPLILMAEQLMASWYTRVTSSSLPWQTRIAAEETNKKCVAPTLRHASYLFLVNLTAWYIHGHLHILRIKLCFTCNCACFGRITCACCTPALVIPKRLSFSFPPSEFQVSSVFMRSPWHVSQCCSKSAQKHRLPRVRRKAPTGCGFEVLQMGCSLPH